MIALKRASAEQFAAAQAELLGGLPSLPPAANLLNALHLTEPETLRFRGREFRVAPISGLDGYRLMALAASFEAAQERDDPGQTRQRFRALLRELGRLARPPGWRGWLARLRPDPFRRANFREVQELMGFFGRCQTTSSVWYRFRKTEEPPPTGWN